jgi:molybdopterin molybdotransferase
MVNVSNALKIIKDSSILTSEKKHFLSNSLNYYLAEDIYSPINMPPFSQSAMDGYAICGNGKMFTVVGEVKAGDIHNLSVNEGEAYRIFTGGMIPKGTTLIAKQEIVKQTNNTVELLEKIKDGTSIRVEGEELNKDDLVLRKGTKLTPSAIGLLSGLGLSHVKVFKKPKVALVVTGNELTRVGQPLEKGKIYESNSYTIKSALLDAGIDCEIHFVKDDFNKTKSTIGSLFNSKDVVVMTGGISVGDYDFVGKALLDLGVEQKFYKVKQKPGKPLFYGEINQTKVFGLPGNPAAALTSFYVYVLTAIKVMMGANEPELLKLKAKIGHDYCKKGDRAQFLKAQIKGNEVNVHTGQSSAMLSSFADANCLLFFNETDCQILKGQEVNVLMLQ